jgi:dephospho-CoA kinase
VIEPQSAVAPRRPLWLGVTGNIACGKSTVVDALRDAGADAIDADAVYANLVTPGSSLLGVIADRFGAGVVAADGSLDRRALANIVFADPAALADLDRIVRPPVVAEILRRAAASTAPVVAIDAIKLIESGLADRCDEVWVVTCSPDQQLARLMARNSLGREAAKRRISAQTPVAAKLARADRVIDNSGTREATRRQVAAALAAALERQNRDDQAGGRQPSLAERIRKG